MKNKTEGCDNSQRYCHKEISFQKNVKRINKNTEQIKKSNLHWKSDKESNEQKLFAFYSYWDWCEIDI